MWLPGEAGRGGARCDQQQGALFTQTTVLPDWALFTQIGLVFAHSGNTGNSWRLRWHEPRKYIKATVHIKENGNESIDPVSILHLRSIRPPLEEEEKRQNQNTNQQLLLINSFDVVTVLGLFHFFI